MDYILLSLIAMIMFGMELTFSKIATGHVAPENIVLLRCVFALIIILAYMIYTRTSFSVSQYSWYASIAGVFMGVGFLLMFNALAKGPVSVVAPICGMGTILATVIGILILHESISIAKLLGILFACAAIILVSR